MADEPTAITDISCIIVNWKTKELTRQAVDSILATRPDHLVVEIIVVDNGSADGSDSYLSGLFAYQDDVTVIPLPTNIGYGPALNIGARIAKGEWFLYLNSDIIMLDKCLATLHEYATVDPEAGLYAPRVLNRDLTDQDVYGVLQPIRYRLFISALRNRGIDYANHPSDTIAFQSISGVAYFVHRDFVARYGGWAEDYIMFSEDWDFCFRMYLNGKKCILIRPARLVHLAQSSSAKKWTTEQQNRVLEITGWMFARRYADPGLYELMWVFRLLRSILRGVFQRNEWERARARAKLWFLFEAIHGFGDVAKHMKRHLDSLCRDTEVSERPLV